MIAAPLPGSTEHRRWGLHLDGALADKQFELFYQPLVALPGAGIIGFEALLRWRHPSFGLVSPDRFIPIIEDIGLIVPVGEWVIRRACEEAAFWPPGFKLAVNLSAAQFADPNLVHTVGRVLRDTGLPPARLELELAEPAALHPGTPMLGTFAALRGLGVRLTLDDVGAGPAAREALAAAVRCGFSRIKLRRDLVAGLAEDTAAPDTIVDLLDACARDGIAATAKGVENAVQRDRLTALGCDEVQGFLFSPPRPAWAIPDMLDESRDRGTNIRLMLAAD